MNRPNLRSAAILLLAIASASCGSATSQKVLTVEEVVPRIDELNGHSVSVAGYLSKCGGYECVLYRNKGDADEWDGVMASVRSHKRVSLPDHPTLGIGNGTNFDFDAKAVPFRNKYVVVTGTITNKCRFQGKPACTDRSPDIKPVAIRSGSARE